MVKSLLTDHIKATCIAIKLHVLRGNLHIVIREDSVRSSQEAEKNGLRVQFLDHIEESHNDVVATSSLSTGENTSNLCETKQEI